MGVWSCVGVPRFVDSVTEVSENCGRAGHVVGGPCLEGLGTSTVNGLTGRELVEEWQMSSVDLEDPWGLLVSIESEEEERIPIVGRGITIGRGKGVCVCVCVCE